MLVKTITNSEKGFVVTPEAGTVAGAISYWRLSGAVELAKLAAAWKLEGLNPKMLPHTPTPLVALRRALGELQRGRRLVRPLAKRGAWVIVDETVVNNDTRYSTICRVRYDEKMPDSAVFDEGDRSVPEVIAATATMQIRTNYRRNLGELAPEDISSWLVGLAETNQSVSLRDTGGIYFVPRPAVELWRKVARAVEKSSNHKVFQIPALRNDEAVAAILDAVTAEAAREVTLIEAELTGESNLGARALDARAAKCATLLAKVGSYETLLGVKMEAVRTQVENLRASVAAAAMKDDADAAA